MRVIVIDSTTEVARGVVDFLHKHHLSTASLSSPELTIDELIASGEEALMAVSNGYHSIPVSIGPARVRKSLERRIMIYEPRSWKDWFLRRDPSPELANHIASLILSEFKEQVEIEYWAERQIFEKQRQVATAENSV